MKIERPRRPALLPWMLVLSVLIVVGAASCGSETARPLGQVTPESAGELQIQLSLDPDPPQAGPTIMIVEVKDKEGKPVDGAEVRVEGDMPSMGHGGISGQLEPLGSGKYQASGRFSMGGDWRVRVEVSKSGLPSQTATFNLSVR